jgi:hypothetical protein
MQLSDVQIKEIMQTILVVLPFALIGLGFCAVIVTVIIKIIKGIWEDF